MATKTEVEIKFGDLEMLVAVAPFDQDLAALQRENAALTTARQVALVRIIAGPKSSISQYGSWVAENIVYFPNGQIFVTQAENSPILKYSAEATKAHRSGEEFYISEEEAASLENLAKSGKVYTLIKNKSYEIPIKKFAQDGLAKFVFGDTTADYANFLQKAGVNEVPVWLADTKRVKEQKAPFARALWLGVLNDRSVLSDYDGILDLDARARGVRKASDQVSQKSAWVANEYKSIVPEYGFNFHIWKDV